MNHRKVALIITLQCVSISQIYLYFGGSSRGREIFYYSMDYILPSEDDSIKVGGLILLVFAVPLMVAGAACILLLSRDVTMKNSCSENTISQDTKRYKSIDDTYDTNSQLHESLNRKHISISSFNPIPTPHLYAMMFILLPCVVFYICNIWRHYSFYATTYSSLRLNQTETELIPVHLQLSKTDYLLRQLVEHIANDSAMMGLVALAYILVPVSKHNPLVVLSNWSPIEVLVVHNWAGRLGIAGVLIHGGLHLICGYWRYWNKIIEKRSYSSSSFWYGYLPPWLCWKRALIGDSIHQDDYVFGYGCYQETTPCECYDFFLNLTGLLGMIAFVVLGCSSVEYVRRNHYRVFYILHIIAGPCFLIMTILHYNKAILYLSPSLLYYASTTIPTYIQNRIQRSEHSDGTRILSVTKIPCPSPQQPTGAVWDIVFGCTYEVFDRYKHGQHCSIHVPEISMVSHPFTANKVRGHHDRMRLLIRETGPFTSELGKRITDTYDGSLYTTKQTPIHISGFYGISHRLEQLRHHDHVVIIAGGIGITPYISLMMDVINPHHSATTSNSLETLELHWICRDISLIQYLRKEYFSTLLGNPFDKETEHPSVKIIVHYTGSDDRFSSETSARSLTPRFYFERPNQDATSPMIHAHFSIGTNQYTHLAKVLFLSFTSIFSFGLMLVWGFYAMTDRQDTMRTNILCMIFTLTTSIGLSVGYVHLISALKSNQKAPMAESEIQYSTFTDDYQRNDIQFPYEQQTGRPRMQDLLHHLKDADNPGIFVCGPKGMVNSVREAAGECIPIYQELFEQ